MLSRLKQFFSATGQTKAFIVIWAIYGIALIITTLYCYARLDFVRSQPKHQTTHATQ